jgi:hypothetical protein
MDETHCTLILKDGTRVEGIYTGYARLVEPGTGYSDIDVLMRKVAQDAGIKAPAKSKSYF